jgi:hypothetical protein
MSDTRRTGGVWMLLAAVVAGVVVAGVLLLGPASDRYRAICEARGHLWVQPTHGEPYCGDGSG